MPSSIPQTASSTASEGWEQARIVHAAALQLMPYKRCLFSSRLLKFSAFWPTNFLMRCQWHKHGRDLKVTAMRGARCDARKACFTVAKLDDFVPQDHPLRAVRQLVNAALSEMNARF